MGYYTKILKIGENQAKFGLKSGPKGIRGLVKIVRNSSINLKESYLQLKVFMKMYVNKALQIPPRLNSKLSHSFMVLGT